MSQSKTTSNGNCHNHLPSPSASSRPNRPAIRALSSFACACTALWCTALGPPPLLIGALPVARRQMEASQGGLRVRIVLGDTGGQSGGFVGAGGFGRGLIERGGFSGGPATCSSSTVQAARSRPTAAPCSALMMSSYLRQPSGHCVDMAVCGHDCVWTWLCVDTAVCGHMAGGRRPSRGGRQWH